LDDMAFAGAVEVVGRPLVDRSVHAAQPIAMASAATKRARFMGDACF
jgi:hypothetical protein